MTVEVANGAGPRPEPAGTGGVVCAQSHGQPGGGGWQPIRPRPSTGFQRAPRIDVQQKHCVAGARRLALEATDSPTDNLESEQRLHEAPSQNWYCSAGKIEGLREGIHLHWRASVGVD